jgi:hypothetical protein
MLAAGEEEEEEEEEEGLYLQLETRERVQGREVYFRSRLLGTGASFP